MADPIVVQLTALYTALMSGALRVRFEDREVTYRDPDEIIKAIQFLQQQSSVITGTPRTNRSYVTFGRGCVPSSENDCCGWS